MLTYNSIPLNEIIDQAICLDNPITHLQTTKTQHSNTRLQLIFNNDKLREVAADQSGNLERFYTCLRQYFDAMPGISMAGTGFDAFDLRQHFTCDEQGSTHPIFPEAIDSKQFITITTQRPVIEALQEIGISHDVSKVLYFKKVETRDDNSAKIYECVSVGREPIPAYGMPDRDPIELGQPGMIAHNGKLAPSLYGIWLSKELVQPESRAINVFYHGDASCGSKGTTRRHFEEVWNKILDLAFPGIPHDERKKSYTITDGTPKDWPCSDLSLSIQCHDDRLFKEAIDALGLKFHIAPLPDQPNVERFLLGGAAQRLRRRGPAAEIRAGEQKTCWTKPRPVPLRLWALNAAGSCPCP